MHSWSRSGAGNCHAGTSGERHLCLRHHSRAQRNRLHVLALSPKSNSDTDDSRSTTEWRRRHVLTGFTAAAASYAAGAPKAEALRDVLLPDGNLIQAYEHGLSLSIMALRGSVPNQWIMEYRTTLGRQAGFTLGQRKQLQDIFSELQDPAAKNSAALADVATLGDAWMAPAIRQGLIRPIPGAERQRWWQRLAPRWQHLMRRDHQGRVDPHGAVYGCPYRWGCAVVAYRKDKLLHYGGRHIQDWGDLLQPKLKGHLALSDHPRELLAIALKSLGLSANATAADMAAAGLKRDALRKRVQELRSQVRLLSSQEHVRALSAGDVWAAVGWSHDLIPLAERSSNLVLVAPASGTLLWADVWVVPAHAQGGSYKEGPSPLLPSWLEFSVMPGRVVALSGLKTGASPQLLGWEGGGNMPLEAGDEVLQGAENYLPAPLILERSQFLEAVDDDTRQLYADALRA